MTSNKKTAILALVVLAVLIGLVAVLCTRLLSSDEPAQVKYDDPVVARMHDEKYVAKLNDQLALRTEILRQLAAAKAKLDAAKAAGASEEELAKCQAEIDACVKNFEMNQRLSETIVRDQMRKSTADQQMNKQLQQKGN